LVTLELERRSQVEGDIGVVVPGGESIEVAREVELKAENNRTQRIEIKG
jgi:hypothetical protein